MQFTAKVKIHTRASQMKSDGWGETACEHKGLHLQETGHGWDVHRPHT